MDGNSLEAQEAALRNAGASTIYSDAFTGKEINLHTVLLMENAAVI